MSDAVDDRLGRDHYEDRLRRAERSLAPLQTVQGLGHQRATSRDDVRDQQNDPDDEEHPRYLGCDSGDAGRTRSGC
jgi:hypothetical protein